MDQVRCKAHASVALLPSNASGSYNQTTIAWGAFPKGDHFPTNSLGRNTKAEALLFSVLDSQSFKGWIHMTMMHIYVVFIIMLMLNSLSC